MIKTVIGFVLIAAALICAGYVVYEYLQDPTEMSIWSATVLGGAGFHGACMLVASFLLAKPVVKKDAETPTDDDSDANPKEQ